MKQLFFISVMCLIVVSSPAWLVLFEAYQEERRSVDFCTYLKEQDISSEAKDLFLTLINMNCYVTPSMAMFPTRHRYMIFQSNSPLVVEYNYAPTTGQLIAEFREKPSIAFNSNKFIITADRSENVQINHLTLNKNIVIHSK